MSDLSSGQLLALVLIPKFSGAIGLVCSAFLGSELIRDMINYEGNAIKRSLLAVCVFELCDSFAWFLSSWVVPYSEGAYPFSMGTKGSCNFQGFLLQAAVGSPLNFLQMTFYFYLIVVKNRSIDNIGIKEWWIHFALNAFTLGAAFVLLFLGHYNPLGNICYVNGYPSGCNEAIFGGDGVGECIRGANSHITGLTLFYLPLWTCMILVTYLNWQMRGYLLATNSTDATWITKQALLYCLAFLVTWTPTTIWWILSTMNHFGFLVVFLAGVFEPLQGFWNLMIFVRNRPDSLERLKLLLSCKICSNNEEEHDEEENNGQHKSMTVKEAVIDAHVELAATSLNDNTSTALASSSSSSSEEHFNGSISTAKD